MNNDEIKPKSLKTTYNTFALFQMCHYLHVNTNQHWKLILHLATQQWFRMSCSLFFYGFLCFLALFLWSVFECHQYSCIFCLVITDCIFFHLHSLGLFNQQERKLLLFLWMLTLTELQPRLSTSICYFCAHSKPSLLFPRNKTQIRVATDEKIILFERITYLEYWHCWTWLLNMLASVWLLTLPVL